MSSKDFGKSVPFKSVIRLEDRLRCFNCGKYLNWLEVLVILLLETDNKRIFFDGIISGRYFKWFESRCLK